MSSKRPSKRLKRKMLLLIIGSKIMSHLNTRPRLSLTPPLSLMTTPTILWIRGIPLYTMLEEIRKILRSRFDKRFQLTSSWESKVTCYVEKKLTMIEVESRNCSYIALDGRGEFDVLRVEPTFLSG